MEQEAKKVQAETAAKERTKNFDFNAALKDTLSILKNVFKHPATKAIAESKNFKTSKDLNIFSGVAVLIYLVIGMISAVIQTVVTKRYLYSFTGGSKTKIDFSNLDDFDFLKVLGTNFMAIVGVILTIAVAVYLLALVFKKRPNFSRLVSVATIGYAPIAAASFIAVILSYIWAPLAVAVTVAGATLSLAYIISANNDEIKLEGDKQIFFHVIVVTAITMPVYFISMNILKDMLSGLLSF